MSRRCRAFTLIEMLGVIAIMAMLSGAAAMMLGGTRHAADLQQGIEQIAQSDASARALARSLDQPVILSMALTSGQIRRSNGNTTAVLGNLPDDVKIQRERVGDTSTDFGNADITFNPRGCSNSYAVKLATSSGDKQWIVFAGLSGQMLKVSDEDIDAIFANSQR
jgi:prepilin-type N-terminal cleavage/methylation domain-containing protein